MSPGTLARDAILATLRQPYPTVQMARDAANALLDALAGAIPTQTFVDHTALELGKEGMEVPPPPST